MATAGQQKMPVWEDEGLRVARAESEVLLDIQLQAQGSAGSAEREGGNQKLGSLPYK